MILAAASEDTNATQKYYRKELALDPETPGAKTDIKFAKMGRRKLFTSILFTN